jgi:hypothetical protein
MLHDSSQLTTSPDTHGSKLDRGYSGLGDPLFEVVGVEADEVADLEVGDAAFGDEAADVAFVDAQAVGDIFEAHECGSVGALIRSQGRARFRALLRGGARFE